MAGFDALYKQTITLFNRVKDVYGEDTLWYPTVIENVHLIINDSSSWDSYGGKNGANARLHIAYERRDSAIYVAGKPWLLPKEWRRLDRPDTALTFAYGDNDDFDFFIEGAHPEFGPCVSDNGYDRKGFYNCMNAEFDHVFAIVSAARYDLIPHFEIIAR